MYATWNLSQASDGYFYGPQDLIIAAGAQLETIYVTPMPETYLSKITGDISGLDLTEWNFEIFTPELARQFVELNFLPDVPRDSSLPGVHSSPASLESVLSKIV